MKFEKQILLVPLVMRQFLTHKQTTNKTDESLIAWVDIQSSSFGDDESAVGFLDEFLTG